MDFAVDWRPAAVFVEAGLSARDSDVAGAGARWPWKWQADGLGGKLSLATEVALHRWSAPQTAGGKRRTTQLTATPVFRWRGAGGASPWFLEAGIGLSYHNQEYVVGAAHQETRWNFNDVIAVGRSFGAQEVSLRAAHFSNAGLKTPNPGDTSVSLRWSASF